MAKRKYRSREDWKALIESQMTTLKLFNDFDAEQLSNALQFLWEMGLNDDYDFDRKNRTPSLYPKLGHYYQDDLYLPLLDMPKSNETKMDQLVRWLESQCAYKDQEKRDSCEAQ